MKIQICRGFLWSYFVTFNPDFSVSDTKKLVADLHESFLKYCGISPYDFSECDSKTLDTEIYKLVRQIKKVWTSKSVNRTTDSLLKKPFMNLDLVFLSTNERLDKYSHLDYDIEMVDT